MTKNILALLLILLGISHTKAQTTFSLTELQNLCDYSASDFETYVLKKGYSSNMSTGTIDFYKSDVANTNGKKDIISWQSSTPSAMLLFCTTNKQYYLNLKTTLVSNGFTLTKREPNTVDNETVTWCYYIKGDYKVIIYTNLTEGVTWYNVMISKI